MPPSSRKRNKGKERKAKQQAKKDENERAIIHGVWINYCSIRDCNHGHEMVVPADDHPVSNFIDQFFMNLEQNKTVEQLFRDLFKSHPQIWNNESYRELVIGIMIRIGSNMLLDEDMPTSWPLIIAQSLMVLEHYDGTDNIDSVLYSKTSTSKRSTLVGTSSSKRDTKCRDLNITGSSRRDALKFYRKRTTCKCLKKMHLEARKTMPKMGNCWHCHKEMERVSLSVCSRCMVPQYCSRECQLSDWPGHVSDCDMWSNRKKGGSQIG